MPRLVIFIDLDDTLLQTAAKCPPGEEVKPVAVDRAGRALSFMTRAQQRLLEFWRAMGTVIPVTGRTDDALARVAIAFNSWRITHHGAVIRQPDGRLPEWWSARIQPLLAAAQPSLQECAARLEAGAATGGYRVSRHSVAEWLSYVSVKADEDGVALSRVREDRGEHQRTWYIDSFRQPCHPLSLAQARAPTVPRLRPWRRERRDEGVAVSDARVAPHTEEPRRVPRNPGEQQKAGGVTGNDPLVVSTGHGNAPAQPATERGRRITIRVAEAEANQRRCAVPSETLEGRECAKTDKRTFPPSADPRDTREVGMENPLTIRYVASPSAETETRGKPFIRILGGTKGRRIETCGVSAWNESRTTTGPRRRKSNSDGVSRRRSASVRITAPDSRWPPACADFSSTTMRRASLASRASRMAHASPAGPAPTIRTSAFNWPGFDCTSAG